MAAWGKGWWRPLRPSSAHQRTIGQGSEATGDRHWALLLSSSLLKPVLSPQATADPVWYWGPWRAGLHRSWAHIWGNLDRPVGEGVEVWVSAPPTVPCSSIRRQGIEDLIELQLPSPRTGVAASGMARWDWTLADPWPRT